MLDVLTISLPGLEASVNETIQATNYNQMLGPAHFINAAVERINCSEHTALDVLFAFIHSMAPELRDWPYEADDDWLLLEQLSKLADRIRTIIRPFLPVGVIPKYHSHTADTLTMLFQTSEGHNYAF